MGRGRPRPPPRAEARLLALAWLLPSSLGVGVGGGVVAWRRRHRRGGMGRGGGRARRRRPVSAPMIRRWDGLVGPTRQSLPRRCCCCCCCRWRGGCLHGGRCGRPPPVAWSPEGRRRRRRSPRSPAPVAGARCAMGVAAQRQATGSRHHRRAAFGDWIGVRRLRRARKIAWRGHRCKGWSRTVGVLLVVGPPRPDGAVSQSERVKEGSHGLLFASGHCCKGGKKERVFLARESERALGSPWCLRRAAGSGY